MRKELTRRQAFVGTGALVAATTVGIATQAQEASATVSGEFTIPDSQTVLADTTLEDVRLSANVSWEYQSNAPLHGVELELHAGATVNTLDMLARYENTDIGTDQLSGEETLQGSLMNASDFDISDFQPDASELRRTVIAELRFYALRNGEVVAEARQTDTFEVVIKNEELQVDMTLGGSGEVTFETS